MKEATGELNMTVVTIVAIGALVAFFYLVIWPAIQTGMTLQSACSSAGGATIDFRDDEGKISVHCENNVCTEMDNGAAGASKACGS